MSCGAEKTSALADLHKDVKQPGEGQEGKDLKDARVSYANTGCLDVDLESNDKDRNPLI